MRLPTKRLPAGPALVLAMSLAACGDVRIIYGDYYCPHDPPPGILVEFVARDSGHPVAVGAGGTLRDGSFTEQMKPHDSRQLGPDRAFALAGAYHREGVYEVRVETYAGEVLQWSGVRVSGDRCGPFTVVLRAALTLTD